MEHTWAIKNMYDGAKTVRTHPVIMGKTMVKEIGLENFCGSKLKISA